MPVQPSDPGCGKWTPYDSTRPPSGVKRAKSEEMDAARAKLCPASVLSSIPPPAWLAMGNSQACEYSARLSQTAGSPSGWRTSMLAKQRFDPARGVAAAVAASAWSGGGCGTGVALWMPWSRQRAASDEGSVGGIAD